jgi:uncharacterized membrane protein YsdA (DUF1294 family)
MHPIRPHMTRPRTATKPHSNRPVVLASTIAGAFFAGLLASILVGGAPIILILIYAAMSLISFIAYGFDKIAAQKGEWRTPESTLHLLDAIGGWPGALVAQRALRHKTRKTSFQLTFWCTVTANLAGVTWLLLSNDAAALRAGLAWG